MKFFGNITKKAKNVLIIGILANVALCASIIVVAYAVSKKNNNMETLRKDIWIAEEKTKKMYAIKKLLEDAQEELNTLDFYFTTNDEIVAFIEEIENMGESSGVSVSLRSVDIGDKDDGALSVSLITSGKWKNVYHFLNLLELFPANIRIDKASLSKKERDDGNIWVGDFSFSLLSFSEK